MPSLLTHADTVSGQGDVPAAILYNQAVTGTSRPKLVSWRSTAHTMLASLAASATTTTSGYDLASNCCSHAPILAGLSCQIRHRGPGTMNEVRSIALSTRPRVVASWITGPLGLSGMLNGLLGARRLQSWHCGAALARSSIPTAPYAGRSAANQHPGRCRLPSGRSLPSSNVGEASLSSFRRS